MALSSAVLSVFLVCAICLAGLTAINTTADKIATIAITIKSSIKVNPFNFLILKWFYFKL